MQHHCGRVFWNKSLVAAGSERRERSCVDPRGDPTHADKQKMKRLIWDCQKDIAAYVTPQSGIGQDKPLQMLTSRLDGGQAERAWATIGTTGGRTTMMVKTRRRNPRASDSETA